MDKWKQQLIDTERGVFEVFIKGEGPPLCVAHHYSVFNESGDYFAESFTADCTVYLVNLREAGKSAKAEEPYQLSMLETIFDLEAVRKAFEIERWGFAGHSTGGMLGVLYGIYGSKSLEHLIVVGAAAREYATFSADCIYNEKHSEFENMQALLETLKRADLTDEKRKELSIERTKLSLFKPGKYHQFFNRNITKSISAVRLNFFNRELPIFDVTRKLKFIEAPAFIACGKHDVQCPLPYSVEMKNGIPNSKLVVFSSSNHYPFLEEKDLFQQEIHLFLKPTKQHSE